MVKDETKYTEYTSKDVVIKDDVTKSGVILLDADIPYGKYYLTEIEAPTGYMVLSNDIVITVSNEGVIVEGDTAELVEPSPDANGVYTISVTNLKLYSLSLIHISEPTRP